MRWVDGITDVINMNLGNSGDGEDRRTGMLQSRGSAKSQT